MVKLRAPERDLLCYDADIAICRSGASNDHLKAITSYVAAIGRVLIRPYKGHLVLSDIHALKVEENIRVESALERVRGEVWLSCLDVQTEVHSVLHAKDKVLPDKLCQVCISILPEA